MFKIKKFNNEKKYFFNKINKKWDTGITKSFKYNFIMVHNMSKGSRKIKVIFFSGQSTKRVGVRGCPLRKKTIFILKFVIVLLTT